jgi:hypothetical protein
LTRKILAQRLFAFAQVSFSTNGTLVTLTRRAIGAGM